MRSILRVFPGAQNDGASSCVLAVVQEIYKEPDYLSMGRSLAQTVMLLHDSVSFVMGQVVFNGQRMAECDASKTSEMAKMKYEMGRMAMKVSRTGSFAWRDFGAACRCWLFLAVLRRRGWPLLVLLLLLLLLLLLFVSWKRLGKPRPLA